MWVNLHTRKVKRVRGPRTRPSRAHVIHTRFTRSQIPLVLSHDCECLHSHSLCALFTVLWHTYQAMYAARTELAGDHEGEHHGFDDAVE